MDRWAVKAVQVKVSGRVQGVAFRWEAQREALRLGVTGWVRNEPDGAVAAHLEGDEQAVDAMVAWCGRGFARRPPEYAMSWSTRRGGRLGGEVLRDHQLESRPFFPPR